ncbi:MAG: putative 3-oxopropanoate dehydrogenase [Alphaproteobacteria bacterium MarineAlpha9_Bin4]|nr:methylmalonate-semialdehyde dehydrogenase (CoA acylating) [Pelagibacterales bacterium]PPR27051.1 MAG: putative 3-oxopropanoate dehydrogenase [Alphaproteobacteria bacterium MarineAlpha9_Bin4]|tara:strand:+ start:4223 stop:5713 length:1491 start_codon:yes stop_codon:yes gene_type:complete
MKIIKHYIEGKEYEGGERTGDIFNPATGEIISKVQLGDSNVVKKAVDVSLKALEGWQNTTPAKRAGIMFNYKKLLEENVSIIAELVSKEHGKTIDDAKGSLQRGLEVVEYACSIPNLLKGEFSSQVGTGIDTFSMKQPLGICVGITPFNFPVMIPLWMFPLATACGNAFILKPSERDPSSSLKLVELFEEAGAPKGLVNVINGDKEVVDALIENNNISSVSFVGSSNVAAYIYEKSASFNKRVQALGSAKNHMVVMPDADIEQASDALIGAAYGSAGERCMAISVAVAVGNAADRLIDSITPKINKIKVGPYNDKLSEMGPVVSKQALERIQSLIASGVEEGANLLIDGRDIKLQGYENGYFVGPCLFDKVKTNMNIYKEEIFGPVLSVVRADNYDQALKIVKDNPYGNGCSIFTRDGDTARDFSNEANIGMVGVNVPIPVPVAYYSFGGWKNSIFGGHNAYGMEAVRFYTRVKTVTSKWPQGLRQGAEFKMPTLG